MTATSKPKRARVRRRVLLASALIAGSVIVVYVAAEFGCEGLSGSHSPAGEGRGRVTKDRPKAVLIHGRNDTVTPVEDARRVAAATGATLIEVPGSHQQYFDRGVETIHRAIQGETP